MSATRLLIVEDSELTAGALRLLFEQLGHEVDVAADVRTAILSVMESKPDLMLLDLTLPDGDGLDVLATLRDQNRMPGRTIALTGHDDDELRARCIQAGCIEVLLKPVPIARLRALVQST
ncbi:MAG: response regulator [Gemmatimonadaceae bacterium]